MVSDIAFVPMHVEGEDSLIGNMDVTAEIVQDRFRRQLHEHAVPAARAMLERGPVDAILFGCTIWGGMIREVDHLIDAVCIDPDGGVTTPRRGSGENDEAGLSQCCVDQEQGFSPCCPSSRRC